MGRDVGEASFGFTLSGYVEENAVREATVATIVGARDSTNDAGLAVRTPDPKLMIEIVAGSQMREYRLGDRNKILGRQDVSEDVAALQSSTGRNTEKRT